MPRLTNLALTLSRFTSILLVSPLADGKTWVLMRTFRKNCGQTMRISLPEIAANAALVLLAVACSLLDRQLTAQARACETEGGFAERLYRVRSEKRSAHFSSNRSTRSTPATKD
jgi:four helix bundle suffix protein